MVFGLNLSFVLDLTSTGHGHQSYSCKVNDKVLNIVSLGYISLERLVQATKAVLLEIITKTVG